MKNYIFGNIQNTKLGQIFNSRRDLHDARIHGPLQAGIWGKGSEGACSIVLSGGYIDDIDNIDKIVYTGDSGRDANTGRQSSDQVLSPGNSGLIKSYHDKLPIRVTRGFQTSFGPKSGYRYDGLYFIDKFMYIKGSDGFMVYQFYLSSDNTLAELKLVIDKTILDLESKFDRPSKYAEELVAEEAEEAQFDKVTKADSELTRLIEAANETGLKKAERIKKANEAKAASDYTSAQYDLNKQNMLNNPYPVQVMKLSRRSENGLLNAGIKTLEDLAKVDDLYFSRLPNLGKKSIDEIKTAFLKFKIPAKFDLKIQGVLSDFDKSLLGFSVSYVGFSTRINNLLLINNIKTLHDLYELSNDEFIKILFPKANDSRRTDNIFFTIENFLNNTDLHDVMKNTPGGANNSLASLMDRLFATKYEKHKGWLIDRLFHGDTLEECGKVIGVTRERIRQVQSKFIRQIKLELSYEQNNIIEAYLESNAFIRNVFELEQADPIFSGISKYLASATKPNEFYNIFFTEPKLARWESIEFEYRIFSFHVCSAEEIIASYNLNGESHFRLSLKDSVKAHCLIARRVDAFEYIYKEIHKKYTDTAKMARYAIARLRYKNPGQPIKVESVVNQIKEEFNYDAVGEKRVIGSIFNGRDDQNEKTFTKGLYAYGKFSFIFADDAVDPDLGKQLVAKVLEELLENIGRQFNLKNILRRLLTDNVIKNLLDEKQINMTHELLTVMMRMYAYAINSRVIDHGRLVWSISDSDIGSSKAAKRIEKYPLILKILKENGAPMRLQDISKEVSKVRGSSHFQIHTTLATPKVTLIQAGLWGLRDRDINVTKTQEEQLVAAILQSFDKGKKIIDIFDILKFKESFNINPSVKCFQIAKMLFAYIPVGRRRTLDKVIFLQKCSRIDMNKFAIYSSDITDKEIDNYLFNLSLEELPVDEFVDGKHGGHHWPLEKACQFFIKTNIKNAHQYVRWRRYDAKDKKSYLPQRPEVKYGDKWLGWDRLEEML